MAKKPNQKLKLLYLVRIFEQQTDEKHPMTVQQLIDALAAVDISAERKSIYDDIEALQQFGLDIVVLKGRSNAYYLGERHFQLPELKLLVDAAQSAKFITSKKSGELIKKISSLTSRYEATVLRRQVHVQGRVKTMNESIYYTVDTLQNAMAQNSQIICKYSEWAVDPHRPEGFVRRWRHDGRPYTLSPWVLIWDDENYYLVAFDSEAGMIKHFRVDKLAGIQLTGSARDGQAAFEKLDIAEYTTRTFGMFGGTHSHIQLRCANRLVGVMVDRFGKDVHIRRDGEGAFTFWLEAVVSPQLVAWLLGFGDEVRVLQPPELVRQLQSTVASVQALYN